MEKALLYKEWKKTRLFTLGIAAVGIILLGYIMLKMGRSFRMVGMEHLWDVVVNRKQFLFRSLKYFPIAAALCLGMAQYFPEVIQKRIKLSLHLPLPERKVILLMYGYGLGILLGIYLLQLVGLLVFSTINFPYEFTSSTLKTIAPWYMAGIITYLFVAMVCLEPVWKRRAFNGLLGIAIVYLFFLSDVPSAYQPVLYILLVTLIAVFPFGFLSVQRFKEGTQD
ncbi:hypothetical protein J1N10_06025 [Carboxylicivirga sp. A043]|uniref:hypothetical protein n=1 Tax=Carboxylicivirga litoralis TaxID=2816963 RepID=UPI0021CB0516|nr:hypothetical protein [Carboxylicivirga sp. A043]MCU4155525.1 hypothetical protein [Carboxylicivirga sp. A043]